MYPCNVLYFHSDIIISLSLGWKIGSWIELLRFPDMICTSWVRTNCLLTCSMFYALQSSPFYLMPNHIKVQEKREKSVRLF